MPLIRHLMKRPLINNTSNSKLKIRLTKTYVGNKQSLQTPLIAKSTTLNTSQSMNFSSLNRSLSLFPYSFANTGVKWNSREIPNHMVYHSRYISTGNIPEIISSKQNALNSQNRKPGNKILLINGQGIGPECINAAKKVLDATGANLEYIEGTLGYPDAKDLFTLIKDKEPEIYASQFGSEDPVLVAMRLENEAKKEAKVNGNVNDFYKKLLAKLNPKVLNAVKLIVFNLEKKTLQEAQKSSAVLKGALRTLDEGDEPSRNVTIRKAFEQYVNIRRCVTLDPIAPGMKGVDILFVRENVEDLYASIEHRLSRNYPQALRHQTPEGCELICRAAFEAALRDGRKKVTALEKPNILKITGGLFKETFFRVAKDYTKEKLGDSGLEANFMIIDDGLAAIAATPEKFDVIVTSNMFGDIGSDIAAKVSGGVGLVSSNNINPNNPKSVSMFETMGGTADDIAGQNKANPVAIIDAAADMLLHIGGNENIIAAELIKTAILEVLAEGYYVGDIKKGPYQEARKKEKLGTVEFTQKIVEKVTDLKIIKKKHPEKTIKQIAIERANEEIKPVFNKVLRSYENYANHMLEGSPSWVEHVKRNIPPNPVRSVSKIVGFDLFVDNSGVKPQFDERGLIDKTKSKIDPQVANLFEEETGIDLKSIFNEGHNGSIQSIRSFGQYSARIFRRYIDKYPDKANLSFGTILEQLNLGAEFSSRFSDALKKCTFIDAVIKLEDFAEKSIKIIQLFYCVRAAEIEPVLKENGFRLMRITSRGTEIYPTMCDFEKREIDRFRIEIDPLGSLGKINDEKFNNVIVQLKIAEIQKLMAKNGWMITETILNRNFVDAEGPNQGKHISGVSVPYGKDLGLNYVKMFAYQHSTSSSDKVSKTIKSAAEELSIAITEANELIKIAPENYLKVANLTKEKLMEAQSSLDDITHSRNAIGKSVLNEVEGVVLNIREYRQNLKIMKEHLKNVVINDNLLFSSYKDVNSHIDHVKKKNKELERPFETEEAEMPATLGIRKKPA